MSLFKRLVGVVAAGVLVVLSGCGKGGSTVTPPHLVVPNITWATPAAVTIGTALDATELNASSTVSGNFVYTPAAGTIESTAGPQTLSTLFTPTDTKTYATATASVTLTVTQITPAVTWATPAPITAGTALSTAQLNATSNVPGTFVYTPPAGTVENTTGPQTLSTTFTPTDAKTYTTATATVVLTVGTGTPKYTFNPVKIVGGGYITGIVMHPTQKGLMYVRTDVGGAYRWDAANSIWIPITDMVSRQNGNASGIESIGLDPSDPQRLYMAAGLYTESYGQACDMFVSDDQGATYTIVPLAFKCGSNDNGRGAGERLAVDPNLGTTLYFGSRLDGLWKSTDRGLTWNQVTTFPVTAATSGVGIVFVDFVKSSSSTGTATKTIYAGVSATGTGTDPQSLYVSNDAGLTWLPVPAAPTGLYISHGVQGADGNLYLSYADQIGPNGVNTGKIFQYVLPSTTNPTGTFTDITPPRTPGTQGGYGGLAMDPELPGTIMVSTLDHYYPLGDDLWRSLDYGKTWYSINTVGAVRDTSLSPWVLFHGTKEMSTSNWPTALAIDPFDSKHVLHGNGQTIFATANMTTSDDGKTPSNWAIGASGIEETVILGLISPPSGPANLLSVMGDLGGFQHTDFTVSPVNGAFNNPGFGNGTSIDFAQAAPLTMARVGTNNKSQFGGYSVDGGTTWLPFASNPTGTTNGSGTVAVSADGKTFVWSPDDKGSATSYSIDNGTTWTASTGAPAQAAVLSDRVNPKTFYIYDRNAGTLYTSTDGGLTFAGSTTGLVKYGTLNVSYDAEGSLWLVNYQGLYHATKGTSFLQVSSVQSGFMISEGKAAPGSSTLALYLGGNIGGTDGIWRSLDNGATWFRIDDAQHGYGYIQQVQGDPRVFGRVYLGTGGRGILYADSPF